MKKTQKGFTLIELLVVIAIIGLLSTLAVVSFGNARTKARDARRQSDMKQISTAMELYYSNNNGAYPTNVAACGAAVNGQIAGPDGGATIDSVCGAGNPIKDSTSTYLASIPQDPSTAGAYHYEGTGSTYCISAPLEITTSGAYFVCLNGSCFYRATDCTEAGA